MHRLLCRLIFPMNPIWKYASSAADQARTGSYKHNEKKEFQIRTSVRHLAAKELAVKTIHNIIILEGKQAACHDNDQGSMEQSFVRKYRLPREYKNAAISAELTNDGELTLKIPTPRTMIAINEKQKIPIVCIEPESLIGELIDANA
jgi:HSP20 family molecular chaperone IbpA